MYRFIIVDDEPLIRKGILKKIEEFNIGLEFAGEAENGEDAIELVKQVNPHIVLTDMRMPLMDGRTLLRKLQQDFPNLKVIVISGYSDFEYLQESIAANALDYILKPFNREDIYKSLTKAISAIEKEKLMQKKIETLEAEKEYANYISDINYISGLITLPQSIFDINNLKSRMADIFKNNNYYILASIYMPDNNNQKVCLETIKSLGLPCHFIIIPGMPNENICFLLYLFDKESLSNTFSFIDTIYRKIQETLKTLSDIDAFISSSSIKANMENIHDAYRETVSALNNRDVNSGKIVYFRDNTKIEPKEIVWNKLDNLLFFIESGNVPMVTELLDDFFTALYELSPLTIACVKYNCQIVYASVLNMLKNHCDIFNNYSSLSMHEAVINTTFDFEKIKVYYHEIITKLTCLLKKKNVYPSGDIVSSIKSYIIKNYDKELTLEKLSQLFFINPSYCSFLFKEKTGENFIDYVNKIRIEKAKELLKSTDYKTYKIAKMLGFNNDKYFFRVFKKITQYTPDEYRRLQNKGPQTHL